MPQRPKGTPSGTQRQKPEADVVLRPTVSTLEEEVRDDNDDDLDS